MKSLIKRRREANAICDKCHSPDYKIIPPDFKDLKPWIICKSCGNSWTNGKDGGIYKELEK